MFNRLTVFVATIAVAGGLAQSPAHAETQVTATFEPYSFEAMDGTVVAAERGELWVPENRNDPESRMIELAFVRFASTNPNPAAPIVYLAGGPGGSGVDTARGRRFPLFMALRAVADVIAFDQRGTGWSNDIPLCDTGNVSEIAGGYRFSIKRWRYFSKPACSIGRLHAPAHRSSGHFSIPTDWDRQARFPDGAPLHPRQERISECPY